MNCLIDALTGNYPAAEPKTGGKTEKTYGFAKLLDRIVNSPKAQVEPASDKTARIQPIRKQAAMKCKTETDTDKQSEFEGVRGAGPVMANQADGPDKPEKKEAERIQSELNHEIVKMLSEMLLVPPEQILTAIVDMNIQPVMLQDQAVMEQLVSRIQAVASIQAAEPISVNGADMEQPIAGPDSMPADSVEEKTGTAPAEQALIPAEGSGIPSAVKNSAATIGNPEQLAAAVTKVVQSLGMEDADSSGALEPEEVRIPEIPAEDDAAVFPEPKAGERGQEEDIGESWYSEDSGNDMAVRTNRDDKPETDNRTFTFPQAEVPAAPVSGNNAGTSAVSALRQEAGKNMDLNEVIRQVTDGIQAETLGNGVSELKLILKPESLGEVALKLLSDNGIITARFTAESERVKEIMESNFNILRDSLSEQGISVNQLSVSIGQRETRERRFVYQAKPRKAVESIAALMPENISPPLAAHDSRVSYTA